MTLITLLFWFITPLLSPASTLASICDLPFLAILVANKRIVAARWAALLCVWNTPYDLHVSLFWIAAIRLLAIEGTHFIIRHMLTDLLPRSLLASFILPICIILLSLILHPVFVEGWTLKLYGLTFFLPLLATLILFGVRSLWQKIHQTRSEES